MAYLSARTPLGPAGLHCAYLGELWRRVTSAPAAFLAFAPADIDRNRTFGTDTGVEDVKGNVYLSISGRSGIGGDVAMAEVSAVESATGRAHAWPVEIRLSPDKRLLTVSFDDGHIFALDAEYLRVESPSAEVQGHSPSERKFVAGKKDVRVIGIDPVGRYAIRLSFDDLHSTGIYSWDYLYELGRDHAVIWNRYLEGLAASGGTRER